MRISRFFEGDTIRFTQPSLKDSTTYNWKVCLQPIAHSLQMTVSSGSAWATNSTVTFTFPTGSATYHLTNENQVITLPTVKPTTLQYSSPFIVTQNVLFTSTPTINGNGLVFSLESGSLPSGLQLNPTTGVLSGTATTSLNNLSATIKVSNALGSVEVDIDISVLPNPSSCSSGSTLVHFER